MDIAHPPKKKSEVEIEFFLSALFHLPFANFESRFILF